jgi:hypothetical protein
MPIQQRDLDKWSKAESNPLAMKSRPRYENNKSIVILAVPYPVGSESKKPEIGPLSSQTRVKMPTHLVDVSSVTKGASLIVLTFCIFSLVVYVLTGLIVLHPFIGVLMAVACMIFYLMGVMIDRSSRDMG